MTRAERKEKRQRLLARPRGSESAQLKTCLNCKYRNRKLWAVPCANCSMIDIFGDGPKQKALKWLPNIPS